MMTSKEKQGFDPAAILRVVADATASLEAELTPVERELMKLRDRGDESSTLVYSASEREQAMSDFEMLAVADALSALADEVQAMVDQRMAEAYRMAIDAYYKIEEQAGDPAHADLIPHVAAMRAAHERQYGRPIPPRRKE